MSKSLGNYIGVAEPPGEIFGKIMSISDDMIYDYFELVTDVNTDKLTQVRKELKEKKTNPMVLKKRLGKEIVRMYWGQEEAEKACEEFERVFSKKELPEEIPVKHLEHGQSEMWVGHYLVEAGCAKSTSEVKRLIKQGGLYIDNERVSDENLKVSPAGEKLVRLGKRRFFKIVGKAKG